MNTEEPLYKVSITSFGETYEASGDCIETIIGAYFKEQDIMGEDEEIYFLSSEERYVLDKAF
jgi:hypothetical protein